MPDDPRSRSRAITEGPDRAPARAMLKGIGFTDADLSRPIVGVATTWTETMPCNFNLRRLAERAKEGIRAAGATPMEFNTIAISDGVTMGTEGMKASLVSREVIADSIELVGRGHLFDAMLVLVACDKTIPGGAMALLRLDVPSLLLYGGSIAPGRFDGRDVTIQDVFEAVGAHAAGKLPLARLKELEDVACPGSGACGGQYTANTMALAMGLHPRCGIEDTIIDQHGKRMTSVQQIEQTVRVARELGREIATGKEARAIYRIGVQYRDADETIAANGMTPNRQPGQRNLPLRAA